MLVGESSLGLCGEREAKLHTRSGKRINTPLAEASTTLTMLSSAIQL